MADLFLLSAGQMRRIERYFPLSHGIARVHELGFMSIGLVVVLTIARLATPPDAGPLPPQDAGASPLVIPRDSSVTFHCGVPAQASRSTKMVGEHWENKTPIPLTIGYLVVAPKEKEIDQLMVPKRLS